MPTVIFPNINNVKTENFSGQTDWKGVKERIAVQFGRGVTRQSLNACPSNGHR